MNAPRSALAVLLTTVGLAACAPHRLQLPTGEGEPFPGYAQAAEEATASCRGVRTISAELALSGRAGGAKVRGRVTAGIASPSGIRLEGAAPFGPPVFILAGQDGQATLLLPRDNRVATSERPAAILDSLIGLDLGPSDLLAILAGCVVPEPRPIAGRLFPNGWARLDLAGHVTMFVSRDARQRWRVRAGVLPALRVEYEGESGELPLAVRVVVVDGASGATDIRIGVSQADLNPPLGAEVFRVKVPADALPISLSELRQAGPMGQKR